MSMTWKEFKQLAIKLGIKDDDRIGIHQYQEYSGHSDVANIELNDVHSYTIAINPPKRINAWTITDSKYRKEYISPYEDTGR